jgi:alkanesulfonate monooxygenase SsuD/methylene tetrahydromethanopterin reductase-like flavin-dependent oxidoreductase (luciferase family)
MQPTRSKRLRLGVCYDLRRPEGSLFTQAELYADVLAQAALVDRLGFDLIWLTEHHFVADGYLPSFVPVGAAIAAVTRRIRVSTDVALLPLHNALRLAEDLAVMDNLSDGRMELGIGMGYVAGEFAAFGIPRSRRVSLTEEGIEVLRQAWSEKAIDFTGRRYDIHGVDVYPKPVQPGGPPLWLAAMSAAGAERVARLGLNLLPQGSRAEVLDTWEAAVIAAGGDPAHHRVGIIRPWMISDDLQRDWPPVKAGEVYRAKMYQQWSVESGDNSSAWTAADKIPQTWVRGNADQVYEELLDFVLDFGITDLVSWVTPPGLLPSVRNESLLRFAREVAPRLRAAVDGARRL